MLLEEKINQDLKIALLEGDKLKVSTLRSLKSVILYAKVAANSRDQALPNNAVINLLQKEAKKRQESADLYVKGGSQVRAQQELAEKAMIDCYLPAQLSEAAISQLVDESIKIAQSHGQASIGQVIGLVKQKTIGQADGAVIARIVKLRLTA